MSNLQSVAGISKANKPERVLLTRLAINLMAKMNPGNLIRSLNRSLSYSKTTASSQKVIDLIDYSGISRLTLAVFGSEKTAKLFNIDNELIKRLQKAEPLLVGQDNLILQQSVNLDKLQCFELPEIIEIQGRLSLSGSCLISLPNLQHVYGVISAGNSKYVSLPKLEKHQDNIFAYYSSALNLPMLKEVEGDLDLSSSFAPNLPILNYVNSLEVSAVTSVCFPCLEKVGRGGIRAPRAIGIGFPQLINIDGSLDVENSTRLGFPMLEIIRGSLSRDGSRRLEMPLAESQNKSFLDRYL